jgi:hypothetical protein
MLQVPSMLPEALLPSGLDDDRVHHCWYGVLAATHIHRIAPLALGPLTGTRYYKVP